MKKHLWLCIPHFAGLILTTLFLTLTFQNLSAQQDNAEKSKEWVWDDENIYRKQLEADGIPAATIEKLAAKRKELILSGRNVSSISHSLDIRSPQNPVTQALCSDMGGENGWGGWTAQTGTVSTGPTIAWSGPLTPTAPGFNLTSGAGIDACTPGPNPGDPVITVVAPGFGNASIQIGQPQTNGAFAEQLTYPLTVTAQDSNFVFAYAMVIEDPGHAAADQPFVSFCIYDSNGNPLPFCGCFTYTAGPSIPGFYTSSCYINSVSRYKPWTTVGVNLSSYIGQTLTVEIINADCSQTGHFAHSYWDFACSGTSSPTFSTQFCAGEDSVLLTAQQGAGYNYSWTSIPPGFSSTNDSVIVDPSVYDTIILGTWPPSGCGYYQVFVLAPTNINAGFTFNGTNCNSISFTDTTVITGGTISTWNWSFPGGTPSSSTSQNPGPIIYSPGTYTVSLIVTSQAGCMDTATSVITIGPTMSLMFNITNATTPSCCNGSAAVSVSGGTPPYTYLWSNGCATVPCTGLCTGTYTVWVTDASGCSQTALLTISCVTGIDENNEQNDFIVSPNPSDGMFNVQWLMANGNTSTINHQPSTIEIYNVFGEKVYSLNNFIINSLIDLSSQPSGLYFIRLTQEGKTFATDKLVITD